MGLNEIRITPTHTHVSANSVTTGGRWTMDFFPAQPHNRTAIESALEYGAKVVIRRYDPEDDTVCLCKQTYRGADILRGYAEIATYCGPMPVTVTY